MNTSDYYLYQVLQKYSAKDLSNYTYGLAYLNTILKTWAGGCYLNILISGSRAKGTALSIVSDHDLLVSLTSNCNQSGGLISIYNSLYSELSRHYQIVRKQNVSLRINIPGNSIWLNKLEVDITPARKQSGNTNDHSLWVSKLNTWKQTNIQKHISDVAHSGRTEEIKLLKIWRELNKLEFPSIYLEYLLINNILIYKPFNNLATNFGSILLELARDSSNPLFARIQDPANSNNILSDLLTTTEKSKIIIKAKEAINHPYWSGIIW